MAHATESRTPWLNVVQYPFLPREFDSGEGWMSYVDEGRGAPIVFLHGAPTWSYLFRRLVRELSSDMRCIAVDHLGFGLSDKEPDADYSPAAHARRFARLMEHLGLEEVALALQDCGGPIGLSWALDHPKRVRGLVLFNTWMWSLRENRSSQRLAHLVGNPINRIYYRLLNASPTFILPALFADRHRIPRPEQYQYLEPFRSFRDREGIYRMVESLSRSERWFASLWERRDAIADIPALLLWGTKDPLYGEDALARWVELFRQARVVRFEDVGRFVPEEAPGRSTDAIRAFLR